jgi:uncharacterized cupredoxin-like copper-binding protein
MKKKLFMLLGACAMAVALMTVGACGGSNSTVAAKSDGSTPTTAGAKSPALEVALGMKKEFTITPSTDNAAPGVVTWKVRNIGKVAHEFVIIRTDKSADKLAGPNGEASEKGVIDEIGDIPAGGTKALKTKLKPGHYALICNLPGHYAGGMRTDFTVA